MFKKEWKQKQNILYKFNSVYVRTECISPIYHKLNLKPSSNFKLQNIPALAILRQFAPKWIADKNTKHA